MEIILSLQVEEITAALHAVEDKIAAFAFEVIAHAGVYVLENSAEVLNHDVCSPCLRWGPWPSLTYPTAQALVNELYSVLACEGPDTMWVELVAVAARVLGPTKSNSLQSNVSPRSTSAPPSTTS